MGKETLKDKLKYLKKYIRGFSEAVGVDMEKWFHLMHIKFSGACLKVHPCDLMQVMQAFFIYLAFDFLFNSFYVSFIFNTIV